MRAMRRAALLVALLAGITAATADARQLSIRRYDVADGLAHDQVTRLLEDRHGYLWIGTFEGLSRFDGYGFVSYGVHEGLGTYVINDLAEDSQGRLWVATNGGGVSVLDDEPGAVTRFRSYIPGDEGSENVNVIAFDASGRLWCGTDRGVYVGEVSGTHPVFTLSELARKPVAAAAAQDDRVWMGVAGVGLVEFRAGRSYIHPVPWPDSSAFRRILPDANGVLVASDAGLFRFADSRWHRLPVALDPEQIIHDLLPDGRGGLWLATSGGLLRYDDRKIRTYSLASVSGGHVSGIITDRGGNLWVGLGRNGLGRIRPEQIISYTADQGLPDVDVTALMEDRFGHILALTRRRNFAFVSQDRLSMVEASPMTNRPLVRDGESWWGIAPDGVYHVPGPVPRFDRARRLPLNVDPLEPVSSSLPLCAIDAQGRLWFAAGRTLYRITAPASSNPAIDRWPIEMPHAALPGVFGIDKTGGVWLGSRVGLARFHEGTLTVIDTPPGLISLQPRSFMLDRHGSVWIGLRFGGVLMTHDPDAAYPQFVRYTMHDGLASDSVWALAEDQQGLIYLGTGRGLNQLDPATRTIRYFNTDDGLAGNIINDLEVDQSGGVWVASMGGISRLDLSFAPARRPPVPIYISRILLAGVGHGVPERGATRVADLQLRANARHLRIEFVSPRLQHAGPMRYQYMLDGMDGSWSTPGFGRSVNYGTLAPGRYRFRVRAVTADGRASDNPAVVDFIIHPPFWSSAWFIATLFTGMLGGIAGVQRLREHRRRDMAAVRRQVATDLHDDVGSGLSQIAILSEVAKRKAANEAALPVLNEVADLARSLRESMSDIVWAVDPGDNVPVATIERMRQVTFNLLSSTSEVAFHAPDDGRLARLDLTADRRRQLLLIFKEAMTNVARHAQATKVSIELWIAKQRLRLTIEDNGVGFDPAARHDGHGLRNLVGRAESIGAEIDIQSRPGEGTRINLRVPLRRRTGMFRWFPVSKHAARWPLT